MSALWKVAVEEHNDDTAVLRLTMAHPDAGEFSTSVPFILRLLAHDLWDYNLQLEATPTCPLGEALEEDDLDDDDWMMDHAGEYIAEVEQTRTVRTPFDEDAAASAVEETLRERGLEPGSEEWKSARTQAWEDFWQDPDNLPQAWYRIRATESRWLAHLSAGKTWKSAAYDV